jgi:N-acetylglutamate synthase-like GNAT family acetyltransferase
VITTRKAQLSDVPAISQLINHYVAEQVVLPRTPQELYENVWEFTVAEVDGEFAGCGALKFYNAELAEIRSLCVSSEVQSKGVGRALMQALLHESEQFGLKKVFALTTSPGFFAKLGFGEAARETLPMKIWRDCLPCPLYTTCREITVVLELPLQKEAAPESREEAVLVGMDK